MDRPAKGVIVKSVEIEIGNEMDYKPCTFTIKFCLVKAQIANQYSYKIISHYEYNPSYGYTIEYEILLYFSESNFNKGY